MPLQRIADVRPDPVLTALAVELGTGPGYSADIIAPAAEVVVDTFKFATWGREDINKQVKARRSPGVPANRVEMSKTYTSGSVLYRGLKMDIADEIRGNDPNPAGLENRRVKILTNKLKLEIETAVQAAFHAASNTSAQPTTQWDQASPKIRGDIKADRETFRQNCGFYPNIVVIPPTVYKWLANDSSILDLLKFQNGLETLRGKMLDQIENMQIVVPGMIIDSAAPGASASVADVWSNKEVYYTYVDPMAGNDLDAQCGMRQVRSLATTGTPLAAYKWRDPDMSAHTDWVAVDVNQNEVVVSQAMILRRLAVVS